MVSLPREINNGHLPNTSHSVDWIYFTHPDQSASYPNGYKKTVSGATAQRGPGPPHAWSFYSTHNYTPQWVGLLWTRDRPVAETSTWQDATLTRDRNPCRQRYPNPQSQQSNGRRSSPYEKIVPSQNYSPYKHMKHRLTTYWISSVTGYKCCTSQHRSCTPYRHNRSWTITDWQALHCTTPRTPSTRCSAHNHRDILSFTKLAKFASPSL